MVLPKTGSTLPLVCALAWAGASLANSTEARAPISPVDVEKSTAKAHPDEAHLSADSPTYHAVDVAPVWSGHPVGFALLTVGSEQYVGFYDASRRLVVGQRKLGTDEWTFQALPETIGWDSHNYITMAVDGTGHLHLAANMHVSPLVYFRTSKPGDVTTFRRHEHMVGELEQRCTYPVFLRDASNALIFTYRDGGSGNGNQIYNRYDERTTTWRRLLDRPLLNGEGRRNAYATTPQRGPDGRFHMVWVWRDTPDAATNHDVSYARSADLVHWETSSGRPIKLPITLTTGEIVDPVPAHGGVINGNVHLGFDHLDRPIVSYHKYDDNGNTQIYNTRMENGRWVMRRASNWDYRWAFGGGGSISFEIKLSPVHQIADGRWVQTYTHSRYGSGGWTLDPETLKTTGPYAPPPKIPDDLNRPESAHPGMVPKFASDLGQPETPPVHYLLRWETLGANRDRARQGQFPEPSMLRVIEVTGHETSEPNAIAPRVTNPSRGASPAHHRDRGGRSPRAGWTLDDRAGAGASK
jgi:hypothetical protein